MEIFDNNNICCIIILKTMKSLIMKRIEILKTAIVSTLLITQVYGQTGYEGGSDGITMRDLEKEEIELKKQDNIKDYLNSQNSTTSRNINGVGDYTDHAVESNKNIVDSIKTKLDKKYSNKDNYDKSLDNTRQVSEATEWMDSSAPYNCTNWANVTGGDKRRTCKIKQMRSTNSHVVNDDYTYVKDIDVIFEEREIDITQLQSEVAPTERFYVDYNTDFGTGGSSGSGDNLSGGAEDQGATGPVSLSMLFPSPVIAGYKFPLSWTSDNAEYCDISLLSGNNNGTSAAKEIVVNKIGNINISLTCGNLTNEKTIEKSLVVEEMKCPDLNYRVYYVSTNGRTYSSNYSNNMQESSVGKVLNYTKYPSSGMYCGYKYVYSSYAGKTVKVGLEVSKIENKLECRDGQWYEKDYKTSCSITDYYKDRYRVYSSGATYTSGSERRLNIFTAPDYSEFY